MNERLYRSNPDGRGHWKQEEIKWGNDLSFPDFAGTIVNLKHVPNEGFTFTLEKKTDNIINPKKVDEFIKAIDKSLRLLWFEHNMSSPFMMRVDESGKCNLILATMCNKPSVIDVVLRSGYTELVKRTGVK